jgi:cytochrome c oxidase subunit 4
MTEHVAHEPGHEHHHSELGHDNSPEAIRKEVRKYLAVLAALAALTVVTVAISYIHLPTPQAVALALVVATIKGSLVAAFFMHLISERKLIYAVLLITVFFFGLLLWGPWHQRDNAKKSFEHYESGATAPAPKTDTQQGSGH